MIERSTEKSKLILNGNLKVADLARFVFRRSEFSEIQVSNALLEKSQKSHDILMGMINRGTPIYGVTTGFGDSCTYYVNQESAMQLQKNLIQYLSC